MMSKPLKSDPEISEQFMQTLQNVFSDLKTRHKEKYKQNLQNFFSIQNRNERAHHAEILKERLNQVECKLDDNLFPSEEVEIEGEKIVEARATCFDGYKNITKTVQKVPVHVLSKATPIPNMTINESIQKNWRVEDEKTLVNIPYISDETIGTKKFAKLVDTKYEGFLDDEDVELEQTIGDELFIKLVKKMIPHSFRFSTPKIPNQKIFDAISQNQTFSKNINNSDPAKLRARYFRLTNQIDPENQNLTQNIDGPMDALVSREQILKSYKAKFCRRCFMYGCQIHDPVEIPISTPCTSAALYTRNNREPCGEHCCKYLDGSISPQTKKKNVAKKEILTIPDETWTSSDQSIFNLSRQTMTNCEIARVLQTKTCAQVYEFDKTENVAIKVEKSSPDSSLLVEYEPIPTSSRVKSEKSERNLLYIKTIFENQNKAGPNKYTPCSHDGPCSISNKCPCIETSNFCEKFCGCSKSCKNRFPGCTCQGKCCTKQCVCFSVSRECDPDLCKNCRSDEYDIKNINCTNVNVQRRLTKHLLLGVSDVSGWGVFIKDAVKKNEFITEYTGELITKSEGERRAGFYDEKKHSFLFSLNNQFDVDAMRKGNKIRFANSPNETHKANLYSKIVMVNGDHHVAIFAKEDIAAGEELILDYNWDPDVQKKFGMSVPKKRSKKSTKRKSRK